MAKKRKKPKLLAADIGIIHSGASGKHDKRIKDLKAGIALFSNTNPRINLKAANDLNLAVPSTLLARATDVIVE